MSWSRIFKNVYFITFWTFFFANFFPISPDLAKNKFFCCKFAKFLQILKVEHKSFPVSFVIFLHKTWDLEGGVKLTPPQRILIFKCPAGTGLKSFCTIHKQQSWTFIHLLIATHINYPLLSSERIDSPFLLSSIDIDSHILSSTHINSPVISSTHIDSPILSFKCIDSHFLSTHIDFPFP